MNFNFQILHQTQATLLFFSYVRMIQNHPPIPIRNSKYLAIPPTPLPLRNIKMDPEQEMCRRLKKGSSANKSVGLVKNLALKLLKAMKDSNLCC